jgi:hypothetical protein
MVQTFLAAAPATVDNTGMDEKPRRRWFSFSMRTLLVVVAALAILLGLGRHFLSWELHPATVAKVKAGMTMAEVQEILGSPEMCQESDDGCHWHYVADRFTNRSYEVKFDSSRRVEYVIVWPGSEWQIRF